jgi:hypothetical protein
MPSLPGWGLIMEHLFTPPNAAPIGTPELTVAIILSGTNCTLAASILAQTC